MAIFYPKNRVDVHWIWIKPMKRRSISGLFWNVIPEVPIQIHSKTSNSDFGNHWWSDYSRIQFQISGWKTIWKPRWRCSKYRSRGATL